MNVYDLAEQTLELTRTLIATFQRAGLHHYTKELRRCEDTLVDLLNPELEVEGTPV